MFFSGSQNQATKNLVDAIAPSAAKKKENARNMNTATSEIKLLVPKSKQILTTIKSSFPISVISAGKLIKEKQNKMEKNSNTRYCVIVIKLNLT